MGMCVKNAVKQNDQVNGQKKDGSEIKIHPIAVKPQVKQVDDTIKKNNKISHKKNAVKSYPSIEDILNEQAA